ncbi:MULTISPECIES: contractile injection system sheath initiator [Bacillati]|uniref:contractile injection system sheath initiator n=1 Tax=Bacillati TaxID=1783272 RepID=UPI0035DEFEF2
MKTLKLVDGDLVFTDGELEMVEGDEELKQALEMILKIRLGEFFLEENVGLDRTHLLTKQFDEELAHYDIVEALMQEERIEEISEITFSLDKTKRLLTVSVTVKKIDGTTIELEEVSVSA